MKDYEIETNVAGVDSIGDIWGGKTIWHYDSVSAIH